jgi:hypothetical protein
LSNKRIQLEGTVIHTGGVGAWGSDGKIEAKDYSLVTAAGTFAKATNIEVKGLSTVTNKIFSPVTISLPPFEPMTTSNFANDPNIPDNATVILNGSAYKGLKVGKNATVIFTAAVVDFRQTVKLEDGATVKFTNTCCKVRIKGNLEGNKSAIINPDGNTVIWYIDGNAKFLEGANVTGVFYLGGSNSGNTANHVFEAKGKSGSRSIFTGMFIAEQIHSGKYTDWYMATFCHECLFSKDIVSDNLQLSSTTGAVVENFPNPFSSITTVTFTLPSDNHVNIDVYDLAGKLVLNLFSGDVSGNQPTSIDFDGSLLPAGLYVYKMATGTEVFTGKMILVK